MSVRSTMRRSLNRCGTYFRRSVFRGYISPISRIAEYANASPPNPSPVSPCPGRAGMNDQPAGVARDLLRRDRNGVAWLTLNRPAARNALSMALMEALDAELAAIADDPAVKVVVIGGAGPAFCAGHDLREMRAQPDARAPTRRCSRSARPDAADRAAAEAGDRPRARRRDRGRLPACRELRPGGGRRHRALRHAGREYRPVLLHADGGAVARGRPQGGDGDAADRRADRRRDGRASWGW